MECGDIHDRVFISNSLVICQSFIFSIVAAVNGVFHLFPSMKCTVSLFHFCTTLCIGLIYALFIICFMCIILHFSSFRFIFSGPFNRVVHNHNNACKEYHVVFIHNKYANEEIPFFFHQPNCTTPKPTIQKKNYAPHKETGAKYILLLPVNIIHQMVVINSTISYYIFFLPFVLHFFYFNARSRQ